MNKSIRSKKQLKLKKRLKSKKKVEKQRGQSGQREWESSMSSGLKKARYKKALKSAGLKVIDNGGSISGPEDETLQATKVMANLGDEMSKLALRKGWAK